MQFYASVVFGCYWSLSGCLIVPGDWGCKCIGSIGTACLNSHHHHGPRCAAWDPAAWPWVLYESYLLQALDPAWTAKWADGPPTVVPSCAPYASPASFISSPSCWRRSIIISSNSKGAASSSSSSSSSSAAAAPPTRPQKEQIDRMNTDTKVHSLLTAKAYETPAERSQFSWQGNCCGSGMKRTGRIEGW